jgi:ABC-type amino acid transport substrate-binding protein
MEEFKGPTFVRGVRFRGEGMLHSRRHFLSQMRNGAIAALCLSKGKLARAASPVPTLQPGVLRIGTYFVNPPLEYIEDGARKGFEVDLLKEVARHLELRPEFVNTEWEILLGQMQHNLYDCIMGGITITPERERTLAWSIPYMTTTLSLIVDNARSPANMTLADLRGGTVGVQAATTDYDAAIAMKQSGKIAAVKVYPFARIAEAISDLRAGHINATMKVYPVAAWFVQKNPGLRILAPVPDDPQPLGIGFNKNNPDLLSAINRTLTEMQRDGSYRALTYRWGLN